VIVLNIGDRVEAVAAYAQRYKPGWRGTVVDTKGVPMPLGLRIYENVGVHFDIEPDDTIRRVEVWRLRRLNLLELIAEAAR
jgi:hypothetical protein